MTTPPPRSFARLIGVSASLALLTGLVAGCATAETPAPTETADSADAATKITFTDQRGEQVELDGPAESIAATVMPAPATIAAVDGSWDRIVGINQSTLQANKEGIIGKIYPKSTETAVVAGADFVPNMEEILSLDPDVVVQWGYLGDDFISPIETAGIPVVGLEYGTQEDLETWISMFGSVLGKDDRAADIIDWMHAEAKDVKAQTEAIAGPAPRVLSMSYKDTGITVSAEGYAQYVFEMTGVDNVAADAPLTDGVATPEQIIEWDPEMIILSAFDTATPEDVYADPRFADVTAVQEKRVYRSPLGVYRWAVPSAESPLYWNWVAALAHEGEFELDLPTEMTEQIEFLYNYTLTQEDIDLILRTDINADSADYGLVSGE